MERPTLVTSITFAEHSLYRTGYVITFTKDNEQSLHRSKVNPISVETDAYHTVKYRDTIRKIAYNAYKDIIERPADYWWIIADVNEIMNPLDLSAYVGKDIIIPNINKVLASL